MAISKEIVMRKTGDLRPYERNARTHSPEQIDRIARSLEEFGFVNPVLITGDMTVVAGHGRLAAAQKLGLEEVPTLVVDGLTPEQVRAYIIADNRLAEDKAGAGWDFSILDGELAELKDFGFDVSVTGFDMPALDFDDMSHEQKFENKELDPDDFSDDKFRHICPRCGFGFND